MKATIALILSSLSLLGVAYLVYIQQFYMPNKIKSCHSIAVGFEKARHSSGDLEVTDQDITSYMKNMAVCLAD